MEKKSLISPLRPHRYLDLLPPILFGPLFPHPSLFFPSLLPSSPSTSVQHSLASNCDECLSEDPTAESPLSSIILFHNHPRPLSCRFFLHNLDLFLTSCLSIFPFLRLFVVFSFYLVVVDMWPSLFSSSSALCSDCDECW